MRYAQLRLTEQEFIEIKKAALDAKLPLEDFLKTVVLKNVRSIIIAEGISSAAINNKEKSNE